MINVNAWNLKEKMKIGHPLVLPISDRRETVEFCWPYLFYIIDYQHFLWNFETGENKCLKLPDNLNLSKSVIILEESKVHILKFLSFLLLKTK